MDKSIHSPAYHRLVLLLRKCREEAGLTQEDMGSALDETQSWISKVERGERRLDLVELKAFCEAMDMDLLRFVRKFESIRAV